VKAIYRQQHRRRPYLLAKHLSQSVGRAFLPLPSIQQQKSHPARHQRQLHQKTLLIQESFPYQLVVSMTAWFVDCTMLFEASYPTIITMRFGWTT
jgi:hypothetical protein